MLTSSIIHTGCSSTMSAGTAGYYIDDGFSRRPYGYDPDDIVRADLRRRLAAQQNQLSNPRKGIMKTILDDIKSFVAEHRKVIYFIVILLIIDRFFLKRALEKRIKDMAEKLLGTVEKKIDAFTTPPVTVAPVAPPVTVSPQ